MNNRSIFLHENLCLTDKRKKRVLGNILLKLTLLSELTNHPGVTIEISQKINVNTKNTIASLFPVLFNIVAVYK